MSRIPSLAAVLLVSTWIKLITVVDIFMGLLPEGDGTFLTHHR